MDSTKPPNLYGTKATAQTVQGQPPVGTKTYYETRNGVHRDVWESVYLGECLWETRLLHEKMLIMDAEAKVQQYRRMHKARVSEGTE